MTLRLPRLIVVMTALSTVLAGVVGSLASPEAGFGCTVSAHRPVDDDTGTPWNEQRAEESEEEEIEFEIELLAERVDVSSPRCDAFVALVLTDRTGPAESLWPTAFIRGPPRSA